MKIKVSDLIAEFLEKAGIDTIFGIIGSANSHIFNSIDKRGYTKIICVHHEQAAVMAMGAYFRSSGRIAASLVTAGAGSSNAITGVVSNWADSIPGIILSGQEQAKFLEQYEGMRMYGIQGFDSPKMVKDTTKRSITVKDETSVQHNLEAAHFITRTGRPGPVWIDFPMDVQSKMVEPREWNFISPFVEEELTDSENFILEQVLEQMSQAKRPIIWAGHGIRLAGMKNEFRQLVSKLKIPVILSWSGIDLLHNDDPYYFGRAGVTAIRYSNFIVQNCDFLLAIGTRLSLLQAGYDASQFARSAKIVVVDVDKTELDRFGKLKNNIVLPHDCRTVMKKLSSSEKSYFKPEWVDYCNKMKSKYPLLEPYHVDNGYANSYKFLDFLSDKLKGNEVIVTDMGTGLLSGHYSIKLKPDNMMFTSLGLGEMGYGLPGAIGAAFANPDRDIICLNCDGGMMMNLQELQTIIHHKLRIKIVVFNNDGYLMIKHTQNLLFKGERTAVSKNTGVSCPDYSKLGESLGFHITKPVRLCDDTLSSKIDDFLSDNGPTIMEVFMDPEQDFLPKVKGVVNEDGSITPASLEEMSPLLSYEDIEEAMISGVDPKSKVIKRP